MSVDTRKAHKKKLRAMYSVLNVKNIALRELRGGRAWSELTVDQRIAVMAAEIRVEDQKAAIVEEKGKRLESR